MATAARKPAPHPFFWLATLALVVAILARAQAVLVPLALAVLISFALTPAVRALERRVGRALAVATVVLVTLGAVGSFGYLIQRQLVDLSTQMGRYSETMKRKVAALRGSGTGIGLGGLSKTVDQLVQEMDRGATPRKATPVRVLPDEATALERFQDAVRPVLKPLADVVIVLVLVVFLLSQRNDLRDRFIRLAGKRNVSLTTRTMDDAGHRISRFLLVQSAINGSFGLAVAIGLGLIGVPYAPLWGFLAAVLRFVPFVGALLAMLLPATLAFVQLDGWWHTVATVVVFLALDLIVNYAIEPLAIGRKTGVSSLAMIVMAVFWTWLWGPIGLVLSTPLTVCLAVLGRQVPRLQFLAVLLGDEPALEAELTFYQRLLAGDEDEAADIMDRRLRSQPREQAFDELIVPALQLVQAEQLRGELNESDHDEVLANMRTIIASAAEPMANGGERTRRRVLGVPARSVADELVWDMLAQTLERPGLALQAVGAGALVSEVMAAVEQDPPDLVCITSVAPGGLSQVRLLCRRLQLTEPQLRILILRLGATAEGPEGELSFESEDATCLATSLAGAATRAEQLLALDSPSSGDIAVSPALQ